jgi:hypothetical protein
MNAIVIVGATLAVIAFSAAVYARMYATPEARYRRDLRSIRRFRKSIRGGDPNATSIAVNYDAFHGYE